MFRRCQRQYFFAELAAWHNAREPQRREAYVLKQLKTLELWRGLVVHEILQKAVVPCWQARTPVDWDSKVTEAIALARRQFEFSRSRRYRDPTISKTKANGAYCALLPHERGLDIPEAELARVLDQIAAALRQLSQMTGLLERIDRAKRTWSELHVTTEYAGARIQGQIDLLLAERSGNLAIIDWKVYGGLSAGQGDSQTALYAWLLTRSPMWRVDNPESIELLEVSLLDATVVSHRFSAEHFVDLENRVFRSIEEQRALVGDGSYDPSALGDFAYASNPNSCRFCNFRSLCALGVA